VEQLLLAGAQGVGKTVTDELAFSLLGENHFYGTPLNPKAPDRVPGGSSSGSASAVACGLADFAIGTDTGGSVRIPASNCGILGWRPTHGTVSLAGVMPLAPSFDTVGIFARDVEVLCRVAEVLVGGTVPAANAPPSLQWLEVPGSPVDSEVREAIAGCWADRLARLGARVGTVSLEEVTRRPNERDLDLWVETYRLFMGSETWSCFGSWVEDAKPAVGPRLAEVIDMVRSLDRWNLPFATTFREDSRRRMTEYLSPGRVLCMPTSPTLAPRKGARIRRDEGREGYFFRTLSSTSLAGVARLPQVSLPGAEVNGVPIGLSLIGGWGSDLELLGLARRLMSATASG
jgi:amidase